MLLGTAQIDITPEVGAELSGFARRIQPATGILDRLYARGLYLEQDGERLLWIHADLIGVEREFILEFRRWAGERWDLEPRQVLTSATHTHSGPATIAVQEAGAYDAKYVARLRTQIEEVAEAAVQTTEPCDVVMIEGHLGLAVDRRNKATPRTLDMRRADAAGLPPRHAASVACKGHTDPRVAGIGFRRRGGEYAAVITNYAMHAVALGPANRMISADMPGRTAAKLSRQLPGAPIALITNGACGNLNPPFENVSEARLEDWGGQVADAVADRFDKAAPLSKPAFRTISHVVPMPVDALSIEEIEAYAAHIVNDPVSLAEWGDRFRRAVDNWRRTMVEAVRTGKAGNTRDAELFAIRIGDIALLGMNAEVFSRFTDDVRERTGRTLYVVGYANGDMGYIPTRAAYDEGGYEVSIAHMFYCNFRPKAGGLELLAERAAEVIRKAFA